MVQSHSLEVDIFMIQILFSNYNFNHFPINALYLILYSIIFLNIL